MAYPGYGDVHETGIALWLGRHQFHGAEEHEANAATWRATAADDGSLARRLREVIRLRRYTRSTEKTYLRWTNRFLAYQRQTGVTCNL